MFKTTSAARKWTPPTSPKSSSKKAQILFFRYVENKPAAGFFKTGFFRFQISSLTNNAPLQHEYIPGLQKQVQ